MIGRLRPMPFPMTEAVIFVLAVHRKRPKIQGGMFAVGVERIGADVDPAHAAKVRHLMIGKASKNIERVVGVVGVAIVSRPAPDLDDGHTLNVARVAVLPNEKSESGNKGACSMLYGRCARMAKAVDAVMYTYTELDEPGTSLRAAGWIDEGERAVGIDARDGRQVDLVPKRRWRAP